MLSPNFKKPRNTPKNPKRSQQYRLYSNLPRVEVPVPKHHPVINQLTLEMMSPCQESGDDLNNKQSIQRRRTEKLLEYNEGIKEVEAMSTRLQEVWSLFEFEKNLLSLELTSFLKLKDQSEYESKSQMLLEGLDYFFKEINRPADLLEVPASQMVSEILKTAPLNTSVSESNIIESENELLPQRMIISKSIQVLLTAAQIKEILTQKLMIEKICENKGLRIRYYDNLLNLCSLRKKFKKQGEIMKSNQDSLKDVENQRDELRKMMSNFIEKSGVMTTGVDTLNRIMKSNNDMQKTLQYVISQGSPQRLVFSEQNMIIDKERTKIFLKENLPVNEKEPGNPKSIFSPMKAAVTNGAQESDKDMMTPKTATFAEISKALDNSRSQELPRHRVQAIRD